MALARFSALLVWLTIFSPAVSQTLSVGGKNFTEQVLVAEMTSQLLKAKGFTVHIRTGFATSGVRKEQEAGLVDIYWEYTGTSLITFNNITDKLDPHEAYDRVKELDARRGLVWLSPSKVNNTYALAMRKADAAAKGIAPISDLAERVRNGERFRLACNTEFYIRSDGLMPMQRAYGFEFGPGDVVRVDTDRVYDVLRDPTSVDVGLVFSTDGRIAAFDYIVLRDDRGVFPSYLLTPVVVKRALDRHPDLATHLNALSVKLDNATIANLNALIDLQKRPIEEVASSFLEASGLI